MTGTAVNAAPPDAVDFLDVAALLNDEERLIRDTVRGFVRDRVLPNVADWFERGILPRELGRELGRLGLLGMHLDGYGCPGASAVAYGVACTELEAGDSGVRSFASVQGSLAMYAIYRWGSDEQKGAYLPLMASGEKIAGTVEYKDEFTIAVKDSTGWYRSFPTSKVKFEVASPAEAHVDLMAKYTDDDIHNLMAYLQTLR